jgi:hypothetical protein
MTYADIVRHFDSTASDDVADFILWEKTAFPMGGVRVVTKQIHQAVRAARNGLECCEGCGAKKPFHTRHCPYRLEEETRP